MTRVKPGALVLHPGPINRGVEVTPDVADGAQSVILNQVANGLAVRMAVLYLVGAASRAGLEIRPDAGPPLGQALPGGAS